jgi:hypothetical protein
LQHLLELRQKPYRASWMKIAKRTPTQLLVRNYPTRAWGLGAICCLIGLYSFWGGGVIEAEIMQPTSIGVRFAASALFGVGLVTLLRSRVLGYCFDQETGALTLTHRSLLKTDVATFPLGDIVKVKLETAQLKGQTLLAREPANSSKLPAIAYRVVLILASNQPLPLTTQYSEDREGQRRVAQEIAEFLNIEADLPPAFSDLLKSLGNAIRTFLSDR